MFVWGNEVGGQTPLDLIIREKKILGTIPINPPLSEIEIFFFKLVISIIQIV